MPCPFFLSRYYTHCIDNHSSLVYSMDNRRNYYRILQVQPDAPYAIIRTSYLTLLHKLKQHPDLGGDHWNAKVLNEAFQTLSDERKRTEYDKKLFRQYTKHFYSRERGKKESVTTDFCHFCKKPLIREVDAVKCCVCNNSPLNRENREGKRERCKRSLMRTEKIVTFRFITTTSTRVYSAQMVDLTPKGVRFLCKRALVSKEIIKIESALLRAIAEVMSSQKVVKNGRVFYSIGAHFQSVTFTHHEGTFLSVSV